MRVRVLRLPPQVEDALVGVPYLLFMDRMGDQALPPEFVEHLRTQTGARAVFVDRDEIELEDLGTADELEYEKLLAAMQVATGGADESVLE